MESQSKEESKIKAPHYKGKDELKSILYGGIEIESSKYSEVGICFICDITGSMECYIKVIRELLVDFFKNISGVAREQLRLAFIGFRDKDDEKQIECKQFTSKPEEIVEFLDKIKCYGGGDACEDLVAPLKKALTLDWGSNINHVYLLLDAPTHGKRYHEVKVSDDHLDDDKEKMLEKLIVHYRKSKINLVILKCNENVNRMIEIIKKYYDSQISKLSVIGIKEKEMLYKDFARNFLNTSIEEKESSVGSRYRNFKKIRRKMYDAIPVKIFNEMDFFENIVGRLYTGSISGLSFENMKYSYKFEFVQTTKCKYKISGRKIGVGAFADCYPLSIGGETNYVAKLRRNSPTKPEDLKPDIEMTLIAKHFARKFNYFLKSTGKKEATRTINVMPLCVLEKDNSEILSGTNIFLAQRLLEGEFCKFNNNYGWVNGKNDLITHLAQAFSHFTYEFSLGTMMVVDIQGAVDEKGELHITDPAIHSYLYKDNFGDTNHGKLGMIRFFKTHECNDYCRLLSLSDYKQVSRAKYFEAKEKCKGKKGLAHLYQEFASKIDAWRAKIRAFDPSVEPEIAAIEEEEEEGIVSTYY